MMQTWCPPRSSSRFFRIRVRGTSACSLLVGRSSVATEKFSRSAGVSFHGFGASHSCRSRSADQSRRPTATQARPITRITFARIRARCDLTFSLEDGDIDDVSLQAIPQEYEQIVAVKPPTES